MNLHHEAKEIARQAFEEARDYEVDATDMVNEICDSHEVAIYYHKAIQFCADHDTRDGEYFLEDCGSIAQFGDSFGQIACRIAFATLYCAAMEKLNELESEDA